MKKILTILGLLAITSTVTAQANDLFRANALFYDNTTSPFSEYFDGSFKPTKTGEANCVSYFHLVTKGDCSVKKAMQDAGITRVNSIDRQDKSILMFHKVNILVHGE